MDANSQEEVLVVCRLNHACSSDTLTNFVCCYSKYEPVINQVDEQPRPKVFLSGAPSTRLKLPVAAILRGPLIGTCVPREALGMLLGCCSQCPQRVNGDLSHQCSWLFTRAPGTNLAPQWNELFGFTILHDGLCGNLTGPWSLDSLQAFAASKMHEQFASNPYAQQSPELARRHGSCGASS